jgi:hypothetical protein
MATLPAHAWHTTTPTERIVIGRSSAGQPRTYRLVLRNQSWAAQLVASLRSLLP